MSYALNMLQEVCFFSYRLVLISNNIILILNFTLPDCDGINEKEYAQLAKTKTKYSCVLCRGEKDERMDSFHRKNRNKTS